MLLRTSPLPVLVVSLLVLLVAAAPVSAYKEWKHGTAISKRSCADSGCHDVGRAITNDACTQSCHAGRATSAARMCWDCHAPGTTSSSDCAAACHLNQSGTRDYPISFAHGSTPHLGASGYGKVCADCHGAENPHHDPVAGSVPDCLTCHDGVYAAAPTGHEGRGTVCSACHVGMDLPSGDCQACHSSAQGEVPAITSTNDLACADPGCHGRIVNHVGTSIVEAPCITCHSEHYATLGTCTTCHAEPQSFHHATSTAIPLSDCAACHNGTIAATPPNHGAYGTSCSVCHTGMNKPLDDCLACHDKAQGGVPAVSYTNDLTCGDARCHSMISSHSGTPIKSVACATCHTAHYEGLGTCATCHPDSPSFHHGTATATPLVDCRGCHDGGVAADKESHAGFACVGCHGAMTEPLQPATCMTCHEERRFGTRTCTHCHSIPGWINEETVHEEDPAPTVGCATCHRAHYADLGACGRCHGGAPETHHGVTTPADTRLRLSVSPAAPRAGTKVKLRGRLLGAAGALASQTVTIQARKAKGGAFKTIAVAKTGADGRFARSFKPRASTRYRVVWNAPGGYAVQQDPAVSVIGVRVRPR